MSGTVSCWDSGSAQCQHLAEPSAPGTGAAVTPGSGSVLYLLHPLVVSVLVPPLAQGHLGRMLLAHSVPGVHSEGDLPPLELQGPGGRDDAIPAHLEACVVREEGGMV